MTGPFAVAPSHRVWLRVREVCVCTCAGVCVRVCVLTHVERLEFSHAPGECYVYTIRDAVCRNKRIDGKLPLRGFSSITVADLKEQFALSYFGKCSK